MSVSIRKINRRLRSKAQLNHSPSGHGKGKWHSLRTLWAYKMKIRKKRQAAKAARRRNRGA